MLQKYHHELYCKILCLYANPKLGFCIRFNSHGHIGKKVPGIQLWELIIHRQPAIHKATEDFLLFIQLAHFVRHIHQFTAMNKLT